MMGAGPVDYVTDPQSVVIGADERDRITWDGTVISGTELIHFANETRTLPVSPIIIFKPDPSASYGRSFEILATLKSAGLTDSDFCFGDLERNRQFDRVDKSAALHNLLIITPGPFPADQAECDSFQDAPPPESD